LDVRSHRHVDRRRSSKASATSAKIEMVTAKARLAWTGPQGRDDPDADHRQRVAREAADGIGRDDFGALGTSRNARAMSREDGDSSITSETLQ
jgi:hypothetical protein